MTEPPVELYALGCLLEISGDLSLRGWSGGDFGLERSRRLSDLEG